MGVEVLVSFKMLGGCDCNMAASLLFFCWSDKDIVAVFNMLVPFKKVNELCSMANSTNIRSFLVFILFEEPGRICAESIAAFGRNVIIINNKSDSIMKGIC